MNRVEAERIAGAINLIRTDWYQTSLMTLLERHQKRPARDVMLALVWIAYDPDTKTPGRIDQDGPWWSCARAGGPEVRPAYLAPQPPIPIELHPASPDQIRAIRAAAREEIQ